MTINLTAKDVDSLPPGLMQKPSPDSFQTPSGNMFTPGQRVTHSSGVTGQVVGAHPESGKAIIRWDK